jgi:UDP-glucose 4-epimerase
VPYGESKLAAEGQVSAYDRLHGIPGISLRLGNVYGPRQDPDGEAGVIAIFSGRLHAGERPVVFGDGTQTRDYVFVSDAVEALVAAGDSTAVGAYNIGTGNGTSVLDLLERLGGIAGTQPEPEMAPARGEIRHISIDPSRAREALGWEPRVPLSDGLKRTFDSFKRDR